jgi:isochorismate synthase
MNMAELSTSLVRAASDGPWDPHALLAEALAEPAPQGAATLAIAVPAPLSRPEIFLCATERPYGFAFCPPTGPVLAGAGVTHRIAVSGPGAPDYVRAQADAIFARLSFRKPPGCDVPAPCFFGGLAFQPSGSDCAPWQAFGDGCFTLPRWTYARHEGKAWLSVTVRTEDLTPAGKDTLLAEHARISAALRHPLPSAAPVAATSASRITHMDPAAWARLVAAIRQAISEGRFEKIVAARRCQVDLPEPIDDTLVLARLSGEHPDCTRFAFRREAATFLGATPERLVKRQGERIDTQALAGSIGVAQEGGAVRLLHSQKDLEEQAMVVREIHRRLSGLCASLEYSDTPTVRTLKHIVHLNTPIHGRLKEDTHILELVSALHPTPAVGGVPTRDAVRWIAEHEPEARGWYAGPVGYFDAQGDGEFVVALRSGVLAGARAYVYAGAGIVAGSNPDEEYAETGLKQQALLRALGLGT